jgi:2-oxoglutarate ferredoxin oxidoreductase subunit beta
MIAAAGAPYVARWTTYHPRQIIRSIKKAIQKRGFSLVEVISQCPVQFGRASKLGKAVDMLKYYKKNSINIKKSKDLDKEALKEKIVVGEFVDIEKPELASELIRLKKEVGGYSS